MQIVIELEDLVYEQIKTHGNISEFHELINCGVPLPKGHGRLIDADMLWDLYHDNDYDFYEALDDVQTIIEADGGDVE